VTDYPVREGSIIGVPFGDARVDAVMDVAGLTVRAGDRVSAYSLGMRQRLAPLSSFAAKPLVGAGGPRQAAAALVAELASLDGANLQRAEQVGEMLSVVLREHGPSQAAAVNRQLVEAGLEVSEVRTERRPLRDVFLELTGGRSGGADSLRQPAGRRKRGDGHAPDRVH
jgi:ABC-type multidrug transport system ATPase subunit